VRDFHSAYVSNGSFSAVLPAGRKPIRVGCSPTAAVLSVDGCWSVSAITGRKQVHKNLGASIVSKPRTTMIVIISIPIKRAFSNCENRAF
jgi:hypothetical protein